MALMNAPFEPGGWTRAIEAVAEATRSDAAHLIGLGGPLLLPLNIIVGRDADRVAAYCEQPEMLGPANWRLRSVGRPTTVQFERDYEVAREGGETAYYDDAISDLDMRFGSQTTIMVDDRNFIGLALLRGERTGPSDEEALKRFRYLVPLIMRAVRVQLALDGEAAELMLGDMASLDSQLFLIDRHGCLSAMTLAAESLLEGGPARLTGLSFGLSDLAENRQLHRAMARLLGDEDNPTVPGAHVMTIGHSAVYPAGRWRLSLVRLPVSPHGLGFGAQLAVKFESLHPRGRSPWARRRKSRSSGVEMVQAVTRGSANG
jgi:hypothetical protein